jgi:hypothetical protein
VRAGWHPLAAAVVLAVAAVLLIEWRAAGRPLAAGFWFDGEGFGSAMLTDEIGGALTGDELVVIEAIAWDEVRGAFAGQRLTLTRDPDAFFRVRVQPAPPPRDRARMRLAGESRPLGPFGGQGVVYFQSVAGLAVTHAPPHAERTELVAGIGRGLGRAAVHEFAHQLLPGVALHDTTDADSYEFQSANRASQFYGTLHWAFA